MNKFWSTTSTASDCSEWLIVIPISSLNHISPKRDGEKYYRNPEIMMINRASTENASYAFLYQICVCVCAIELFYFILILFENVKLNIVHIPFGDLP